MIGLVAGLGGMLAVIVLGVLLAWAGTRAGDRPSDVTVTAAMSTVVQPDGPAPVAAVTLRNPGPVPVLVGLSLRAARLPGWPGRGMTVSVPVRTARPWLQPGRQAVVGVAGPGATARWLVPVPARGRHYCLTAVAGQDGRRLRVIRLPVRPQPAAAPATAPAPGPASRGC